MCNLERDEYPIQKEEGHLARNLGQMALVIDFIDFYWEYDLSNVC